MIHNIQQGTPEWHTLRRSHFTASEALAMMGESKYQTRSALLKQKASGLTPEVDEATQRRFDAGHAAEAAYRTYAEQQIGDTLYPITVTDTIDGLPLLSSLDGATMDMSRLFEHKLYNQSLADTINGSASLDPHYYWQLEQQLLVSGADACLFVTSDGTPQQCARIWYKSIPERRAALIAGWKQFAADLAAYADANIDAPAPAAPVAATIEALPLPVLRIEGRVIASNIDDFRVAAQRFLDNLPKQLATDQDFADGEAAVKACKQAEDRLVAVKESAQAQAADIDAMFRALDTAREQVRSARLALEKQVKTRKEEIRYEIASRAQAALSEHVRALNERIGWFNEVPILSPSQADFGAATKGLKTVASLQDAAAAELARAKIASSQLADTIEANKRQVDDVSLVPDFMQVCTKAPDDFAALLALRRQQRAEAAAVVSQPAQAAQAPTTGAAPDAAPDAAERRIRAFIASREWKKGEETRIRAVLVEYEKFTGIK